jgi:hypothetical protein
MMQKIKVLVGDDGEKKLSTIEITYGNEEFIFIEIFLLEII